MALKDRLNDDMKAAMKAGAAGKLGLSVIRLVRAAIKNLEIERGHELQEAEIVEVLAREVKQRQEARVEFHKGGRTDLVEKADAEVRILQAYLPAQLSPDEIRALARQVIAETGASGPRDMGKVMSSITPRTRGRADGRLVSEIVKELLQ